MTRKPLPFVAVTTVALTLTAIAQERNRAKTPDKYKWNLTDLYRDEAARRGAHTLTENEEKILAAAGPLAGGPSDIYTNLTNADFPYPTVTLSDGRSVKLDQAAFSDLRMLPNRGDREKVMSAFFNALGSFGRTFGTTINGEVQKVQFFRKARKYD